MANKFTRRRLLTALGAGAISVALANTLGCKVLERTPKVTPLPEDASSASAKGVWTFHSRPELGPPFVEVTTQAREETAPGYIFVASKKGGAGPGGSMILDDRGEVVWFRPTPRVNLSSMDFKVQHYKGEPVLTLHTWGKGEYGILDSSYREIARLRAGNGYRGDHHEFLITPQDTALITIYNPVPWDLSRLGGSKDSIVYEGVVQELDIESGELLFNASFPSSFSAQDGSYRAFRYEWSGHPEEKPAAVAERTSEEELKLYASWNGATEVSSWEVVAGRSPDQLKPVGSVGRKGFETAMLVQSGEPYVGVRARGRSGEVLGSSEAIKL
jgi:hypothetical protein